MADERIRINRIQPVVPCPSDIDRPVFLPCTVVLAVATFNNWGYSVPLYEPQFWKEQKEANVRNVMTPIKFHCMKARSLFFSICLCVYRRKGVISLIVTLRGHLELETRFHLTFWVERCQGLKKKNKLNISSGGYRISSDGDINQ